MEYAVGEGGSKIAPFCGQTVWKCGQMEVNIVIGWSRMGTWVKILYTNQSQIEIKKILKFLLKSDSKWSNSSNLNTLYFINHKHDLLSNIPGKS